MGIPCKKRVFLLRLKRSIRGQQFVVFSKSKKSEYQVMMPLSTSPPAHSKVKEDFPVQLDYKTII